MTTPSERLFSNKRKVPRQPFTGRISFVYKKKLYPGKLKNYSADGLFIIADNFFVEGEMITVALSVSDHKHDMRKGRIVWRNDEGCGVQFLN
jgi:hypothetical protein